MHFGALYQGPHGVRLGDNACISAATATKMLIYFLVYIYIFLIIMCMSRAIWGGGAIG